MICKLSSCMLSIYRPVDTGTFWHFFLFLSCLTSLVHRCSWYGTTHPPPFGNFLFTYAQAVATRKLYGYMDTNTINKGKRDEIVKNLFIENKYVNRKLKKRRGGGNSVLRVPVVWLNFFSTVSNDGNFNN